MGENDRPDHHPNRHKKLLHSHHSSTTCGGIRNCFIITEENPLLETELLLEAVDRHVQARLVSRSTAKRKKARERKKRDRKQKHWVAPFS